MANRLSDTARVAFGTAGLDWEDGSDWRVLAVDDTYVFNVAHDFLDDVVAGKRLGDEALTGRVMLSAGATAGSMDADDVSITAADGETWAGLWIYIDDGVAETSSPLIAWFDTMSDDTPISEVVAGGSIDITWPALGIMRL
jgi:hypothetical protein